MNIDSIDIVSHAGVAATLSFNDPKALNPYQMKNLYGLDADEISAKFAGFGGDSASLYNLTLQKREVVMRIQMNPDFSTQTYSELRDGLYKVISSSRTGLLKLNFKKGTTIVAFVEGFVSKVESPITTEVPEMQITMNCQDPRLMDPSIQTSVPSGNSFQIVDNVSTAPHGLRFQLTWTGYSGGNPSLKIGDSSSWGWSLGLDIGQFPGSGDPNDFISGDVLRLSSVTNDRYATLTRSGQTYNIADKITARSQWPLIYPGTNDFYFESGSGSNSWAWNNFEHQYTYWGV